MPKLPKGMKRRWNAYYLRRIKSGHEVWIPLGSDYTEACKKLRGLKRNPVVVTTGTVSQLADLWLKSYVATARNEKGQRIARQRVDDYLKCFLGLRAVNGVKRDDLREYRLWLEGKDISVQTVAHVLSDARCFFGWAEDSGYIERSPVPKRMLPRIQERPPDRLSEEEVARLVSIEEPWGFVVRLGLGTGLRWGELTRARAGDACGGLLTVSHTKSGKVRRVPLSPGLAEELRERVGLVVPRANYWHSVLRMRRLSGVMSFHPHQLRHTFACQWLEQGGSLAALQQILGHASIVTTQRYARLTDEAVQAEAWRVMGKRMGKGSA